MHEVIKVDLGHLLSDTKGPDFLTAAELDNLQSKYAEIFQVFQRQLKEKKSPITLAFKAAESIVQIKATAKTLKEKYDNVLVIGIGGSALGAKAILQFVKGPFYNLEQHAEPRIFILDNLDPTLVKKLGDLLDFKKTALIYASKSGSTAETAANFIHFYRLYQEAGGEVKDIVIMCDPAENGINRIAKRLGCHLLHIPRDLPGRYSVLSAMGFLPAELAGIDCAQLLAGAETVHQAIIREPLSQNSLFLLGISLFELAARGKPIHVLFNYSSLLVEFGLWYMQLWAESLGKRLSLDGEVVRTGTTPLACTGPTDQHSLLQLFKEGPADKIFGFVKVDSVPDAIHLTGQFPEEKEYAYFAGHTLAEQLGIEQLATEMSLVRAGNPCYLITLRDHSPNSLGAIFYFYQALVVFSAALAKVNPFDQPGVEEGKVITYSLMNREDYAADRAKYEQAVAEYNQERKIYGI
jgi:glucose-6-phosphate isomerase